MPFQHCSKLKRNTNAATGTTMSSLCFLWKMNLSAPRIEKMAFDIYWIALVLLLPTVVLLTGHGLILRPFRRFRKTDCPANDARVEPQERILKDEEARRF